MFAILLLDIIGLSARYSKSSLICEGASPGADLPDIVFYPPSECRAARIFDVPSVAGKPMERKMQPSEVMSTNRSPEGKDQKEVSQFSPHVFLGWWQVRVKPPSIAGIRLDTKPHPAHSVDNKPDRRRAVGLQEVNPDYRLPILRQRSIVSEKKMFYRGAGRHAKPP